MEKSVLRHTALWVFLVIGLLLLVGRLPQLTWHGHILRRVDLLADVHPLPPVVCDSDTLPPPPRPAFVDTCRTGMTCIEDYGDSTLRGMTLFYRALDDLARRPRTVRIAYFGDSFIEGDILTADLREQLQCRYGGCGVGFVPVTSLTSGFRPTVRHSFRGWESHSAMDSARFDRTLLGPSGHYFRPLSGASVELRGQATYASRLDTCRRATVYFRSRGSLRLAIQMNRDSVRTRELPPSGDLRALHVDGRIGSLRLAVERADSALFYGLALDDTCGLALDNFSLRGSSGLTLRSVPVETLRQFNRLRPYDLVILHYGLNVASPGVSNYDYYTTGMQTVIRRLKEAFPQAAILLVSVPDRDRRADDGSLQTMPGIRHLVRGQQRLAADESIAFWNLFEAMGGEGSMATLVNARPPMANHDYTHINFRGGRRLAALLYDALVYGKEQYDRRRAYEME